MDIEELRKPKAVQAENARLKKLLADKSLNYDILNDAYELLKSCKPHRPASDHDGEKGRRGAQDFAPASVPGRGATASYYLCQTQA